VADEYPLMRFSTDSLPERERVAMVRDFYGPLCARLDIEPAAGEPLYFDAAARVLPELAVSTVRFSAVLAHRTRALTADGNDACMLTTITSPDNSVVYRGREIKPGAGAGMLFSMADTFTCATVAGITRGVTITIPRKVLLAIVPRLEDRLGEAFPASEPLGLLRRYVELLEQEPVLADSGLRALVVTHVHDLIALALGAAGDAAEIATGRGLRAGRLHAIKADIRASLGEQGLSLTAIAARHRITPRYVQALFADEGTTFSQFLLEERLARVHRMLRHPRKMARSTSDIAYEAGFGDLSHFNRAFRRRYGATPSDVRAAARGESDE
jgi:AraC-like DNA-binding protein